MQLILVGLVVEEVEVEVERRLRSVLGAQEGGIGVELAQFTLAGELTGTTTPI